MEKMDIYVYTYNNQVIYEDVYVHLSHMCFESIVLIKCVSTEMICVFFSKPIMTLQEKLFTWTYLYTAGDHQKSVCFSVNYRNFGDLQIYFNKHEMKQNPFSRTSNLLTVGHQFEIESPFKNGLYLTGRPSLFL